jgi:DNA-binding LacI/PurR family transcriptional regulator
MSQPRKRITIKDVAKQAGVSPGAVSRVLHGRDSTIRISVTTAETIRRVARELDYRPNAVAQSLRSGKTQLIALASQRDIDLTGEDASLIQSLIGGADKFGYSVLLNSKLFGEQVNAQQLGGNFDALVWLGRPQESIPSDILSSIKVPYACLNSEPSAWPENSRHWHGEIDQLPIHEILFELVG